MAATSKKRGRKPSTVTVRFKWGTLINPTEDSRLLVEAGQEVTLPRELVESYIKSGVAEKV